MTKDPLTPLRQTARKIADLEARLEPLRVKRNAEILKAYNGGDGLTERALAEAGGVTKGYVYRIRQGKAPIT